MFGIITSILYLCTVLENMIEENMTANMEKAYNRLKECGVHPSVQRIAIMDYLLKHPTHPTVEVVHRDLSKNMVRLSKTTVYNTLRMLADHKAVQMITIDDHHVCYDGNTMPHVHFMCKMCGKVVDLFDEPAPALAEAKMVHGNLVTEQQVYYKGICADCLHKSQKVSN